MGRALETWSDLLSASDLRRRARWEGTTGVRQLLAVAHALEGMSRAEMARLTDMERQALRDAVVRYNAEGLNSLRDRVKPERPTALSEAEQAVLVNTILRGPDLERDGGVEWTLPMSCRGIEGRFGKRLHPASLSRVVRGPDLSRQKTRP